jgi:pyrroline-5-carboxylate reductase
MDETKTVELLSLGAGRMASAIISGLVANNCYLPGQIVCTCGNDPSGPELAQRTGIIYAADITGFFATASTLLLACKPQQLDSIPSAYGELSADKLVVSILAGVTLERLQAVFPQARNIVRTMPNTPGQIGAGVTAYAPLRELEAADQGVLEAIMGALGKYVQVGEAELDAVTALSGSGPAYVFALVEAMRDGGIAIGLDEQTAAMLATETVIGASMLLQRSGETPQALRAAVTSPGGTTAAALRVFEEEAFADLLQKAMEAAKTRSQELGKGQ